MTKDTKEVIEEMRDLAAENFHTPLDLITRDLESPIEEALFWALLATGDQVIADLPMHLGYFLPALEVAAVLKERGIEDVPPRSPSDDAPRKRNGDRVGVLTSHGYVATILPQHEVEAFGRSYRLDFAIQVESHLIRMEAAPIKVAVECDGHDFHERTKEQATRDKARDRDLQAAGWYVARFTGSEIYRDAHATAEKVWAFVHELLKDSAIKRAVQRRGE